MNGHPYLLHHGLERFAAQKDGRTAVIEGERQLSYEALNQAANRIANLLISRGVGRGHRVAVYVDKSIEGVVALYGVLKTGAAYVPLDPKAPEARLGYIVEDCAVSAIICGGKQLKVATSMAAGVPSLTSLIITGSVPEAPEVSPTVFFDADDVASQSSAEPMVETIDKDLAYILYTSGSTGRPKGVMLSHENALGFVDWAVAEVALDDGDRLSSHAPFHFDLSVFDLYAASAVGAALVLVPTAMSVFPTEVIRFIDKYAITVWYSVPSILSMITEHANLRPGDLPSLRCVVFAGEVFPSKYLSKLMGLIPHAEYHNWYGPTETNVCTAYRVLEPPDENGGDIPIGRAIANVETMVQKDDGSLGGVGETGELLVRGSTVMRGYWGDAERTAEKLTAHPFDDTVRDLVYRTGDLVMLLDDGNFRFLGRKDHQIKSRGYRIELGEIESAINSHPDVIECAVTAVPDPLISNRIVAYIVSRNGLESRQLARFCSERIPAYMVPEAFEFRDTLPKTSTGKIDRQSLAAI